MDPAQPAEPYAIEMMAIESGDRRDSLSDGVFGKSRCVGNPFAASRCTTGWALDPVAEVLEQLGQLRTVFRAERGAG